MKALSLKQPYAELVVQGKKKIELRKWNTKFRGRFYVHASKVPDKEAMKELGFDGLPLGCIVGEAELKEVKKYESDEEVDKDKEKHFASSKWGKYGFVLENVKKTEPKPCRGKLGFFEI